jgi:hypothetical protein
MTRGGIVHITYTADRHRIGREREGERGRERNKGQRDLVVNNQRGR